MESDPPLAEILACFGLLFTLSVTWGLVFSIVLLLVLLICSALISGSEVAFFSLSPQDLHDLESDGTPSSKRIVLLRSKSRSILATILIANNFVNIAIVLVSNYISLKTIPQEAYLAWANSLQSWGILTGYADTVIATGISFVITTVFVTFLLVLFGEVAPKIYAKMNNVKLAKMMAAPLLVLQQLFSPLSSLMVGWARRFESRVRRSSGSAVAADKEDIDRAIDLAMTQYEGDEYRIEADILKGIIKFNDVSVKQIMKSRVDVVAVDAETPYDELMTTIKSSGYSRIPVFKEDFDNVTGMLYVKDLINHRHEGPAFPWQKLVRPEVLYVPESKKINDLLKEFQAERKHMAVVVDEYGGSAGIVTLEDVMEEVIGDIKDEFDSASRDGDFKQIDDFTFVFDGKTLINDACRLMKVDISLFDDIRGDADSLAGLILQLSQGMPSKGEEFNIRDIDFIVLSVSDRRIEKVRIKLPQ